MSTVLLCWINRHEYNQGGLGSGHGAWFVLDSLDAWDDFPLGLEISNCLGPALNFVNRKLTLKRIEGERIHPRMDFSNMHKVIAKPTEWSNSTRELAYWKLHPKTKTACLGGPSLVLLGIHLSRENLYLEQGQYYTAESWPTGFWVLALKVVKSL